MLLLVQQEKVKDVNHCNGSCGCNFTPKDIGELDLQVSRDRKGDFKTHVISCGKRYKDALRQDLCLMFRKYSVNIYGSRYKLIKS